MIFFLNCKAQCNGTDHPRNGCVKIVGHSMYICNEGLVMIDGSLEKLPIRPCSKARGAWAWKISRCGKVTKNFISMKQFYQLVSHSG